MWIPGSDEGCSPRAIATTASPLPGRPPSPASSLFRLGYDNAAGYLRGGMTTWQNGGLLLDHLGEWAVHELNRHRDDLEITVLDVRTDGEWKQGHVPGAQHIYAPHLEERLGELDRDHTVVDHSG